MSSLFDRKTDALKRRARKVSADPKLMKAFINMAGEHYISVRNGNSRRWCKDGEVGSFTDHPSERVFITYRLTVKTIKENCDYTLVTKIEKSTLSPDSNMAFETVEIA